MKITLEDVIKLAETKAMNFVLSKLKRIEKKHKFIKITKAEKHLEIPIRNIVDTMEIFNFDCCNSKVKIRYILNYCGCYCPYCGGLRDGSN